MDLGVLPQALPQAEAQWSRKQQLQWTATEATEVKFKTEFRQILCSYFKQSIRY